MLGNNGCVAQKDIEIGLDVLEPGVDVGEHAAESLLGDVELEPVLDVRSWVPATPVRGAGAEERPFVGEVGVDRVPLDACALCDRRDGRSCRTDRRVQLDRCLDDPLPRLGLTSRALLQLVFPLHCTTVYLDLDNRERGLL